MHTFTSGNDGSTPMAGLVQATDGNLYGTANRGATEDQGTIFRLTPSGTFSILRKLTGANGANPRGGLVQGSDGVLYGTTHHGGASGDGTAFTLTPTGTLTTLFQFHGPNPNPVLPRTPLVQSRAGDFYGTTPVGGANGRGTIFKMTATGQVTNLYSFTGGRDGQWPMAALVEGRDGSFYGTTSVGGTGFTALNSVVKARSSG